MYDAFIPESDGSPTPSVEDIRGAGAVGEGRREIFDDAGADGIFEVGAPSGLIGGAVRE